MPRPYPLITKFCALCQTPLTVTNASKEHIFPNAIGGRKTVSDFICRRCNSESGGKWDSELAKQLQLFCTMLDVSRKRGENQPIPVKTVSGRKLIWNTDGSLTIEKPAFDKRIVDDKTHGNLQVRLHGRSAARFHRETGGMGPVRGSHAGFGRSERPRQAGIRGCGQTQAAAALRSGR